ncbi:methyltransferase domain-containing protein, partial [Achromobacter piechaudii]
MSNNSWSAKQYSAFENERTRPVRDLVASVPNQAVRQAVDLGCGPGNSTEVLANRYPDAVVTGMDSSQDMVDAARKRLRHLQFELADIATWNPPQQYDVILANAALQWVPDHATLYPRLVGKLAPGGILAVQTPDNMEEPAHRLARQ